MPLSISTADSTGENLFFRARRINESDKNQVVFDVVFSIPTSRASDCKLILKQNSTEIFNFSNLNSIPNTKTDIKDALLNTTGIGATLLFMKTEKGLNQYRFYGYLNAALGKEISATLIDTVGLVMDTLKSPIGISEDIGHMNIISTIYALTAMPSGTTDPLNPDSIATRSDSTMLKLLITAMMDLSSAHNSPQPDSNEISQGIFTNYMQFMDNVVGKWDTVKTGPPGIDRMRKIHDIILMANKFKIIDPVNIKNHGTLAEYGLADQQKKRMNYAFYEGYSRMHVDFDMWPDSNTTGKYSRTGIGAMFRVSDNVELYEANLKNTFNMFGASFLSGDSLNRRIIVNAKNNKIKNIENDGLWVKGKKSSGEDTLFYSGVNAIRLKIRGIIPQFPVDTSFCIGEEKKSNDDPIGVIIKGIGKSIIIRSDISNKNNGKIDTLYNTDNKYVKNRSNIVLKYNHNYKKSGSIIETFLQGDSTVMKQVSIMQIDSITKMIRDTSGIIRAGNIIKTIWHEKIFAGAPDKTKTVSVFENETEVITLVLKNTIENQLNFFGKKLHAIDLENDTTKILTKEIKERGKIIIEFSEKMKAFRSKDTLPNNQIIPDINNYFSQTVHKDNNKIEFTWDQFCKQFLIMNKIYVYSNDYGMHTLRFNYEGEWFDFLKFNELATIVNVYTCFSENNNQSFGFDKDTSSQKNDYVSIGNDSTYSTKINVNVAPFIMNKYTIESSDSNKIYIPLNNRSINSALSTINITNKSFSLNSDSVKLFLKIDSTIIDSITVCQYRQVAFDSLKVFLINDTTSVLSTITDTNMLNPDRNLELVKINKILKQVAYSINALPQYVSKHIKYDLNQNGFLDYYNDGMNPELDSVNSNLPSSSPSGIYNIIVGYIKGFQDNWRLAQPVNAYDTIIKLRNAQGIAKNNIYYIGDSIGLPERIGVIDVDTIRNQIKVIRSSTNNYNLNSTVYRNLQGLSQLPILIAEKYENVMTVIAHELLHKFDLDDVGNVDNLMYYTGQRNNKLLRYRNQDVVITGVGIPTGVKQNQWNTIAR